jgi:hypothetical protein
VITVFNDTVESEGEANEIAREINHMAESIDEIPLFEAGHGESMCFARGCRDHEVRSQAMSICNRVVNTH